MTPKVLFIQQDRSCPPALLADTFVRLGYSVEVYVLPTGDSGSLVGELVLPDPTAFAAVVPLGARWSVYDPAVAEWVAAEASMLRAAHTSAVPVLGVCFGGQLVAATHGGSVQRAEVSEIGWYTVQSDVLDAGPWFQWHFDQWVLPPGAREIARTANASQAFLLGTTMAVQFHPELDRDLLGVWLAEDREGAVVAHGLDVDELWEVTDREVAGASRRIDALVGGFLARCASGGA